MSAPTFDALCFHQLIAAHGRDADDNFYDRTEAVQQKKRAAVPESLDAATLLGQKACTYPKAYILCMM